MSRAPLPSEFGDCPTKVVLLGLAGNNAQALTLYSRIAGEVSAFLGKARQNRTISESQSQYMQQARPDGGAFRYQYNNGIETVYVTLTTSETSFATTPQPVEPPPSFPKLAIDVVFEPERFAAEDLFHIDKIVVSHGGGTAGVYSTWESPRFVPDPRSSIGDSFPRTVGYAVADDTFYGSTYYYDGSETFNGLAGDHVLYGSDVRAEAAIYNAVLGVFTYDDLVSALYIAGINMGAATQTVEGPDASVQDFGFEGLKAACDASSANRATATWAIVFVETSATTWTYPHGTPLGDYFTSEQSMVGVEFYHRPDSFREVNAEYKVERFDVRNMVAVVAGPNDDTPYKSSSPGMEPPPKEDKRLKFLRYDDAETKVTRKLDTHDERGDPGTFGVGFLAEMKQPTSARYGESTQFDIYVASVNSTAKNAAPGPKREIDRDDPLVTLDVDTTLRIRVRAREFNGVKTQTAGVSATINFKTTTVNDDGTKVEYSDESGGTSGGGEVGPIITGGSDDHIKWAFAVGPKWVDAGGEPSDPDAKDMGALLADSRGIAPTVVGPDDRAAHYYDTTEWKYPIEHMTKIAELTWMPPKSVSETGSVTLKMLV